MGSCPSATGRGNDQAREESHGWGVRKTRTNRRDEDGASTVAPHDTRLTNFLSFSPFETHAFTVILLL